MVPKKNQHVQINSQPNHHCPTDIHNQRNRSIPEF